MRQDAAIALGAYCLAQLRPRPGRSDHRTHFRIRAGAETQLKLSQQARIALAVRAFATSNNQANLRRHLPRIDSALLHKVALSEHLGGGNDVKEPRIVGVFLHPPFRQIFRRRHDLGMVKHSQQA